MSRPLLADILAGRRRERPAVWFMRQAGRCLASYRALRERHGFMELMEVPELAAEVTMQPVRELGVDAAILFSDILVVPQALGMELSFGDKGPRFAAPLKGLADPAGALRPDPARLGHVYRVLDLVRGQLGPDKTLIGFCGGPLTVYCYMMEGLGTDHEFPHAVDLLYREPEKAAAVLDAVTDISIAYALEQARHGIDAFQLFETWAGIVPAELYRRLVLPRCRRILDTLAGQGVPCIFFPRGAADLVRPGEKPPAAGLGLDWQASLPETRRRLGPDLVLQGNLDPRALTGSWETARAQLEFLLAQGRDDGRWIVNLGHGVLPATPEEHLRRVVDAVKNHTWKRA